MKKGFLFIFVVGALAIFITGCGKKSTLKCTQSANGVDIIFNLNHIDLCKLMQKSVIPVHHFLCSKKNSSFSGMKIQSALHPYCIRFTQRSVC